MIGSGREREGGGSGGGDGDWGMDNDDLYDVDDSNAGWVSWLHGLTARSFVGGPARYIRIGRDYVTISCVIVELCRQGVHEGRVLPVARRVQAASHVTTMRM